MSRDREERRGHAPNDITKGMGEKGTVLETKYRVLPDTSHSTK